ncbi:insulinase family protein [Candidatus Gracilibacteria bacterium]|nr:insulinase family protein [Candidatus Gracilibacteria bacterium]
MKTHQKTLKNGLRIQALELPGTNVVTTLVLVGAGSRYEEESISGISHFTEHMFFKGAKKYKKPKDVSQVVDSFGGEFNAFTGKEYAGYFIKSGKENLEKSLDVLSDMLLFSKFDSKEIEKERGVILEEMAMYLDAPMYQISWDFERLVFGNQPLGRDQIGSKKLIKTIKQQQFLDYKNSLYVPENIVICLSGAVTKKTINLVEKFFQMPTQKQSRTPYKFDTTLSTQKYKLRTKKTEQYHVSFGVKTDAEMDKSFPTLKILSTILGGNMSSRMFQHVREKKGLCYSIRTQVDEFSDTGLLTTRAGVKLKDNLQAVKAIRSEYDKIVKNGITLEELENAKNYLCGKIDLQTEDTEAVAHEYAKNELLYKIHRSFDNWKDLIQKVKKEEVDLLAQKLLQPKNFRFAGIGPAIDEEALLKLIS